MMESPARICGNCGLPLIEGETEEECRRIHVLAQARKPAPAPDYPAILECERTLVAQGVTAIKKAISSREWLTEGRGPYAYDDDRWHSEFAAAIEEILEALQPLERVAADWSNCRQKWEDVQKAREVLLKGQADAALRSEVPDVPEQRMEVSGEGRERDQQGYPVPAVRDNSRPEAATAGIDPVARAAEMRRMGQQLDDPRMANEATAAAEEPLRADKTK